MKIAYFFHRDAANPSIQSGRPAAILEELHRAGVDIEPVFPLNTRPAPRWVAKKIFCRLLGRYYRWDREPEFLASFAREFSAKTKGKNVDLVFSPGSEVVSQLQTRKPITFCADATFANLVDYYGEFSNVTKEYRQQGHRQEESSLARAQLAIYPSEWAARSAIEYYDAEPAKVAIIPFGANLGRQNVRSQVWRWIEDRSQNCLKLLFVGRDWRRKGGDIVVATAMRLIQAGHNVELDVVGCKIPRAYRHLSWIRQHGLLSSNNPVHVKQLTQLFANTHFVFVPSRAEAYGLTFAEGNAFGLPVVSTATGGIPTIVRNGWNGLLFPPSATASEYAEAIAASFSKPEYYRQLCRQAFDEFEQRLNWRTFCRKYLELAEACCRQVERRTMAGHNS